MSTSHTTSHTLYRFFDSAGRLLYVGRTVSPARRWREHEKGKPWFDDVASVTREVYDTAADVDAAERAAIAAEHPLHNVAHNGVAPVRKPPAPRQARLVIPEESREAHEVRLTALQMSEDELREAVDCLGEETCCECLNCHIKREEWFGELRSNYDWHPTIKAAIATVETAYYTGHDLVDWYYDLFDLDMFARLRLVDESKEHPLPAYAEFGDHGATVSCPICLKEHRHYFPAGAVLDQALDAGCTSATRGGRYYLVLDWLDLYDDLYAWGDKSAEAAA